jgi:hypothetical protein
MEECKNRLSAKLLLLVVTIVQISFSFYDGGDVFQ